jgi:hypothetical protein
MSPIRATCSVPHLIEPIYLNTFCFGVVSFWSNRFFELKASWVERLCYVSNKKTDPFYSFCYSGFRLLTRAFFLSNSFDSNLQSCKVLSNILASFGADRMRGEIAAVGNLTGSGSGSKLSSLAAETLRDANRSWRPRDADLPMSGC